ncbi:MAG: hypothetical protein K2M55_05750 [Muribaculaceae bacterium]|nr:hypothetical protein [Muribaculaceae bacterium]
MKKLFTMPIKVFAVAGVLAGAGVALTYAVDGMSSNAPAVAGASAKAPESLKDVQYQPSYVTVNGFRLGADKTYYVTTGDRMGVWNRTEVPNGYESAICPFITDKNMDWNTVSSPLASMMYTDMLVSNSTPGFSAPNRSIYFNYAGKAVRKDDSQPVYYGSYMRPVFDNKVDGTVNIGTAPSGENYFPKGVFIDGASISSNTYVTAKRGSQVVIQGQDDIYGNVVSFKATIPTAMIKGSFASYLSPLEPAHVDFTLGGIPGKTYTLSFYPQTKTGDVTYTRIMDDIYFDITIAREKLDNISFEVDGEKLDIYLADVKLGSTIKICNTSSYTGDGYKITAYAIGGEGRRYELSEIADNIKTKEDKSIEFQLNSNLKESIIIYAQYEIDEGAGFDVEEMTSALSLTYYNPTELPKAYVDGKEVQSGCTIMSGSTIEFRNPNEYKLPGGMSEVRTYVLPRPRAQMSQNELPRISALSDYAWKESVVSYDWINTGNTEWVAGAPTTDFVTLYIGTENAANYTDATMPHKYDYKESTFKIKILPRPVEAPYFTFTNGNAHAVDGMFALKGREIKAVNPNTLTLDDGTVPVKMVMSSTEAWNKYALAQPVTDTKTGEATFKIGGETGSVHTLSLSYFIDSAISSYFTLPDNATSFTFTTTNVLPDPVFTVSGKYFNVQSGDAFGIDGVNVVRANIKNGTHKAEATYDYHPGDDGTVAGTGGGSTMVYAALLHGDGYVSSDVVFTRVDNQSPYALQPLEIYVNGEKYVDGSYVDPGTVFTIVDPNWYYGVTSAGVKALPETYVSDVTCTSNSFKATETPGTYTYTAATNGGSYQSTFTQTVKENATAAWKDATTKLQYKVRYVATAPKLLVDGQEMTDDSTISLYDGAVLEITNPNVTNLSDAVAYATINGESLETIAAPDTYKSDFYGRISLTVKDANPGNNKVIKYGINNRLGDDKYILPAEQTLTINTLGEPKVSNATTSEVYPSGSEIPGATQLLVDYRYDLSPTSGNQWHMDIKDQAPTEANTVPASIMRAGSQNTFVRPNGSSRPSNVIDFILAAPDSDPITLILYCTDKNGNLLTNKVEYTFTPKTNQLDAPYVTVDGERVESGCEIINWSEIHIVNPNELRNSSGHNIGSVKFTTSSGEAFDLAPYAYDENVEPDSNGGSTFRLLGNDGETVTVVLTAFSIDNDVQSYMPASSEFTFTIKNRELWPPSYSVSKTTGNKVLTNVAIATNSHDSDVKEYTVHLQTVQFQHGEQLITEKDVTYKDETRLQNTVSYDYAYGRLVASYITAKGCEKSALEIYYVEHEYIREAQMGEPIIHVNRQSLGSYYDPTNFVVKPGDVIDFYNPYVFNVGDYQVYNVAAHNLEVTASDPRYTPELGTPSWQHREYIGHHVITVPDMEGSTPAGAAQRRAPRSALGTLTITSTLTPTAHAYTFTPSEPHSYTFTVDRDAQTGVEEISAEEIGTAEVYTLSGVKVTNVENLATGVYIFVENGTARKVLVK